MNTTAPHITAAEVLATFAQFTTTATRYAWQKTAQAVRTARHWLNTAHDYSNEEGQIILTGWQYVGIACALTVSAFFVSCLG